MKRELIKTVGHDFKLWRITLGNISQREVAEAVGTSRESISAFENGRSNNLELYLRLNEFYSDRMEEMRKEWWDTIDPFNKYAEEFSRFDPFEYDPLEIVEPTGEEMLLKALEDMQDYES